MLLYKVLIELGRTTGKYSISMAEYRYLVATTKVFEDFLQTLLLIKLLREESDVIPQFETFRDKFDNRLIRALKQLPTLVFEQDAITLNSDFVNEVAEKVFIFESNPNIFTTDNYLAFLGSTKSLFELRENANLTENQPQEIEESTNSNAPVRISGGTNILLYGVPGSGKSWTIEHEYCKKDSKVRRLVFHPDYTYSDFIGQILPNVSDNGQVSYKFTPGPFTTILRDAYQNPDKEYIYKVRAYKVVDNHKIYGDFSKELKAKRTIHT